MANSIVQSNLMKTNYAPYCGNGTDCIMPRTVWNGKQFECPSCGWVSSFDDEFIADYIKQWSEHDTD